MEKDRKEVEGPVDGLEHGEALGEEAVEAAIGLLLGAALDDHFKNLDFIALL